MKDMNILDWIAVVLVKVGALNWGLIGLFGFDLVDFIFGRWLVVVRIIYVLVGVAAIYGIVRMATSCKDRKEKND